MDRETFIYSIVDRINETVRGAIDYYSENIDNSCADYAAWGWTEGELAYSNLDDDLQSLVADLRKHLPRKEVDALLVDCAELQYTDGIRRVPNEVYAVLMGEIEEELGEDILADMESLTADELDYVRRNVDAHMQGSYVFIDMSYSRWGLVVDAERFHELATDKLNSFKHNFGA